MDTNTDRTRDLQNEFKELPLKSKVDTLFQMEVITMSEAFEKVADTTVAWGKKFFDAISFEDCGDHKESAEPTTRSE